MSAYDLAGGKKLWETKLRAVGTPRHSAYRNQVAMRVTEGVVSVTGRESFGDYVEILDRKTGTVLAHRIYRQGFTAAK